MSSGSSSPPVKPVRVALVSAGWRALDLSIAHRGLVGYTLRGYVPALESFARAIRNDETTASGIDQAECTLRLERAVARAAVSTGKCAVVERSFLDRSLERRDAHQ